MRQAVVTLGGNFRILRHRDRATNKSAHARLSAVTIARINFEPDQYAPVASFGAFPWENRAFQSATVVAISTKSFLIIFDTQG